MKQSEMVQAALNQYSANVQGESLRILGPGDEFLQDVVDKFLETRSRSHPARVACFYETKSSNIGAIVGGVARQVSSFAAGIGLILTSVVRSLSSMKAQVVSITRTLSRSTLSHARILISTNLEKSRSLVIGWCLIPSERW
jgi:hypothetical protein